MLTMTDAMRQINGIRVLPGSTTNSNFYSRGYQMTTSVDSTPGAAGTLNTASFDLSMYDRIEVLRGSSGLLQGGGSPGGVVNQVTKNRGRILPSTGQQHSAVFRITVRILILRPRSTPPEPCVSALRICFRIIITFINTPIPANGRPMARWSGILHPPPQSLSPTQHSSRM